MIIIREMAAEELVRANDIDMTEEGEIAYFYQDGVLQTRHEVWARPPRSPERWQRYIASWLEERAAGGVALGAFDGDRLTGIATLLPHLNGPQAQLSTLFVSRPYRRTGLARCLVAEIIRLAKESGHDELYVSATPSVSAIGFYLSQGFRPTDNVNTALFELEPEDIHMVRPF